MVLIKHEKEVLRALCRLQVGLPKGYVLTELGQEQVAVDKALVRRYGEEGK